MPGVLTMTDDTEACGLQRRGLLKCMTWAGTAMVWTVAGGVPHSRLIGTAEAATPSEGFSFVQISDSHLGFHAAANPDPTDTLQEALTLLMQQNANPAFMIHTGDITHLSKPDQFDTARQLIS
jgi:3',5'-cyclic-AMP phosphodiesterase